MSNPFLDTEEENPFMMDSVGVAVATANPFMEDNPFMAPEPVEAPWTPQSFTPQDMLGLPEPIAQQPVTPQSDVDRMAEIMGQGQQQRRDVAAMGPTPAPEYGGPPIPRRGFTQPVPSTLGAQPQPAIDPLRQQTLRANQPLLPEPQPAFRANQPKASPLQEFQEWLAPVSAEEYGGVGASVRNAGIDKVVGGVVTAFAQAGYQLADLMAEANRPVFNPAAQADKVMKAAETAAGFVAFPAQELVKAAIVAGLGPDGWNPYWEIIQRKLSGNPMRMEELEKKYPTFAKAAFELMQMPAGPGMALSMAKHMLTGKPGASVADQGKRAAGEASTPVKPMEQIAARNEAQFDIVQRIEEPGVTSDASKPQGLYTSPGNLESPHADLGGASVKYKTNAKNPLRVETDKGIRTDRYKAHETPQGTSTGIAALQKLRPDLIKELAPLKKNEMLPILKERYPEVEWNRYFDGHEMLEAIGGVEARKAGYDAIIGIDKTSPEFSEFVALKDGVLSRPAEGEGAGAVPKLESQGQKAPAPPDLKSQTVISKEAPPKPASGKTVEGAKSTDNRPTKSDIAPRAIELTEAPTTAPVKEANIQGVSHAELQKFRERWELEDQTPKERKSFESALQEAKETNAVENAEAVARVAAESGGRLERAEVAGAAQRIVQLDAEMLDAFDQMGKLSEKGNDAGAAVQMARAMDLMERSSTLADNLKSTGSEAGRDLGFRRFKIDAETDALPHVLRFAEKRKGSKLTEVEVKEHKAIYETIRDLQKQNVELVKHNDKLNEDILKRDAEALIEVEQKRVTSLSKTERTFAKIKTDIDASIKALVEMGYNANVGINPEGLYHLGKLTTAYIRQAQAKGAAKVELNAIVDQVIKKFPDISRRQVMESLNARTPKAIAKARTVAQQEVSNLRKQAKLEVEFMDAVNGTLKKGNGKIPATATPEIQALQRALSKIRSQVYESTMEAAKLERTLKRVDRLQDQLENHYRDIKNGKRPEPSKQLADLQGEARRLIQELKTEDRLLDLQDQLRTGEVRPPEPRPERYVSPQLRANQIAIRRARKEQLALIESRKHHKFPWYIRDSPNAARELMAGGDMSGLRQNALALLAHPIRTGKHFGTAFKTFFSKDGYRKTENTIRTSEYFDGGQEAGLKILDAESHVPSLREEYFSHGFSERIPKIGEYYKAGNRHMTTLGNLSRQSIYDDFMIRNPNATLAERRGAADFANLSTGIGDISALGKSGKWFSRGFFSIKLGASRIQTPATILKYWSEPRVRKFIAADLGRSIAAGNAILGMFYLWSKYDDSISVSYDPDDPDWGKIKIGDDMRIDIWGGFQQPLRLLMRLGKGLTDETGITGKGVPAADKKFDPWDLMTRFAQYKLNPMITIPLEAATGKSVIGEERTVTEKIAGAITPLFVQDVWEAYERGGAGYAAIAFPLAFSGIGVNTYPDSESVTRRKIRDLRDAGYDDAARALAEEWNTANPKDRISSVKTTKEMILGDMQRAMENEDEAEARQIQRDWNKRNPDNKIDYF